jgi:hypothetical protein
MRRGSVLLTVFSMAAGLMGLAVSPSARASWTRPVDITATQGNVHGPAIAVDRRGDATFAWESGNFLGGTIKTRIRYASGRLRSTHELWSGSIGRGPQIASDATGDALVVWTDCTNYTDHCGGEHVKARMLSANGSPGQLLAISPPGEYARNPEVDVDRSGDAVFIWSAADDSVGINARVEIRTLSSDGRLGPVRVVSVSRPGWGVNRGAAVAVNGAGDAVFLWTAYAPGSNGTRNLIQARTLAPDGELGPIKTAAATVLGGEQQLTASSVVTLNHDGNAVLSWARVGVDCPVDYEARSLSHGGALGPVNDITQNACGGATPASNPRGRVIFTWATPAGRVRARSLSAAGALGKVHTISPADLTEAYPTGAVVDANGNALFTWNARKVAHTGKWIPQWRRLSAKGKLGPVKSFTHPVNVLAANLRGNAVAAWSSYARGTGRIRAVFGTVAP